MNNGEQMVMCSHGAETRASLVGESREYRLTTDPLRGTRAARQVLRQSPLASAATRHRSGPPPQEFRESCRDADQRYVKVKLHRLTLRRCGRLLPT
jgi:hypothetical protein